MPTKTKTKVVHDCGPVRSDLIRDENWLAPATPRGAKPTEKESHIIDAYRRGADLHKIVIAHHTHPATLFKLLAMNPAEHSETYASMLKTYNDLKSRALR
jgi:hypothetical protein